jgi:predicted enzyme related to lactoylglutathione lyase
MAHGDFTHVDIPADDPPRALRFYAELFDWQFHEAHNFPGYHLFRTPSSDQNRVGGGIGKRGQAAPQRVREYVEVSSITAALPRVTELGGSIVSDRAEVPDRGWWAVVRDTEGNEIGLWEPMRKPG